MTKSQLFRSQGCPLGSRNTPIFFSRMVNTSRCTLVELLPWWWIVCDWVMVVVLIHNYFKFKRKCSIPTFTQLCMLVLELYSNVLEVTPPYQRFEALLTIAELERLSASTIGQEAYFDELHDFYEGEFTLVREKILHLEAPKALLNIAKTMRVARYRDPKILSQACFVYKMLTSYDQEDPVSVRTIYDMSELLTTMSFFNLDKPDFFTSFISQASKLFPKQVASTDTASCLQSISLGGQVKLKFAMIRFLRHQALFPQNPQGEELAQQAIRYIIKDCPSLGVTVSVDDYKQIYQYLLAVNSDQKDLLQHLQYQSHRVFQQLD